MQEWLLTGRLDIALLYNPSFPADLDAFPLTQEELYFVTNKQNNDEPTPIRLDEIAQLPLVIPNRPNALRMLIESQMASIGCKPRISLEIDGVSAILDLVADGAGHAILPKYAVSTTNNPDAYHMRPIVEPQLISRLNLVTASGRISTLTQNAMLDLIKKTISKVFGPDVANN